MTIIETIKNAPEAFKAMIRWFTDGTAGNVTATFLENGVERTYTQPNAKALENKVNNAIDSNGRAWLVKNYFFDSINGNNENDGTSMEKAFKTFDVLIAKQIPSVTYSCHLNGNFKISKRYALNGINLILSSHDLSTPTTIESVVGTNNNGDTINGGFHGSLGSSTIKINNVFLKTSNTITPAVQWNGMFGSIFGNLELQIDNLSMISNGITEDNIDLNDCPLCFGSYPGLGNFSLSARNVNINQIGSGKLVELSTPYILNLSNFTANVGIKDLLSLKYAPSGGHPSNVISNLNLEE